VSSREGRISADPAFPDGHLSPEFSFSEGESSAVFSFAEGEHRVPPERLADTHREALTEILAGGGRHGSALTLLRTMSKITHHDE
jgi:hypothetical protein